MSESNTGELSKEGKGLAWLRNLFRKKETAPIKLAKTSHFLESHEEPPQGSEVRLEPKRESSIQRLHIGTSFIELLTASGIISPPTSEFEGVGVAAIERTNERGDPYLFESIKKGEKAPNGYLVGIGAGNVFSMLEAFPEDATPKAIILFDIDPEVVKFGENLISSLKENPDKLPVEADYFTKEYPTVLHMDGNANPKAAIIRHHRKLAQLAQEGNLVIIQADFNNPQIAEQIAKLPGFKSSNNGIYLSNISDHLWRRNQSSNRDYLPDISFLQSLTPAPPNQNYYIDTLTGGLRYNLRIDIKPPEFKTEDFDPRLAILNWQVYPHDRLLYPDQPEPVWEDTRSWDIERIKEAYQQLLQKPLQQERIKTAEKSIGEQRQHELQHYPENKGKAKRGIFREEYISSSVKYVVPETEEEEQSLLADLQQPYDYQRDLLPFIAANFWGSAQTPLQIDPSALPKRRQLFYEEGDVRYWQKDSRDWTKGRVELWWLTRDIPYEDLALAKLYGEAARRVKDKNPQADIKGKSFDELVEVLVG